MKRLTAVMLALTLLLCPAAAFAAAGGDCGENLTWTYTGGVLTIEGTGDMTEYESSADVPWYSLSGKVTRVEVRDGATSVCADAFLNFAKLTAVVLPDTVTRIGKNAFDGTDLQLNAPQTGFYAGRHLIYVPDQRAFTVAPGTLTIAQNAFDACRSLGKITLPESLRDVNANAFLKTKALAQVAYGADQTAWAAVVVAAGNEPLTNAAFTFTPVHRHSYEAVSVTGFCDEGRVTTYVCACGDSYAEQSAPMRHESEAVKGKKPTCTEPGFTEGTVCRVCGKVLTAQAELPATGHKEKTIPGRPATCTADGMTDGIVCETCGEILTPQTTIPAAGHQPVTIPAAASTCLEPGRGAYAVCEICGEFLTMPAEIAPLGHDFGDYETTLKPTCAAKGVKTRVCRRCGEQEQAEIPIDPGAHTGAQVVKNVVPAGCETDGYSGDTCCADCGALLWNGTVTALLQHDYDYAHPQVTVPATCAAEGQGTVVCRRCGKTIPATVPLSQTHTGRVETRGSVAAACTQDGYTGDAYCADCGKRVAVGETIPATGHTAVLVPGTPAACTKPGLSDGFVCTVCGVVISAQSILPATGHRPAVLPGVAATCTESGLTQGSVCAECGLILTAQEEIPALGHAPVSEPDKASTCTDAGYTGAVTCSRCGATIAQRKALEKLPHSPVTVPGSPATCVKEGRADGTVCALCGATLTVGDVIPVTAHSWSDYVTNRPATAEAAGEQTRVCLVCGERETRTLDPLPAPTAPEPTTAGATGLPAETTAAPVITTAHQPVPTEPPAQTTAVPVMTTATPEPATQTPATTAAPPEPTTLAPAPVTAPAATTASPDPATAAPVSTTAPPESTAVPSAVPSTAPEQTPPPSTRPTVVTTLPVQRAVLLGDVDFDGRIMARDARLALRISARLELVQSTEQFAAADVDFDGHILAKDARRILRVSAKLETFEGETT